MLRLTDYSTFTPEIIGANYFVVALFAVLALFIGGGFLMVAVCEASLNRKTRVITAVIGIILFGGGLPTAIITSIEHDKAKERVTASIQTWLEDGYGITASANEVKTLHRDRESLAATYNGELTPIQILDVTGGDITVVSSESTRPLEPIR